MTEQGAGYYERPRQDMHHRIRWLRLVEAKKIADEMD